MIYYCIPTHNEEKTVGVVLWKIRHVMAELPRDFQILVGDDASTDGSAAILEPYRRVLPVVLMRNAKRTGYAATLEMLLRQAVRMSRYPKRDVIVVVQADFTDDIDGAATMLRRIESGADIVTGGPVINAVRPGFFERLARNYAHRLLGKFEWPENADPLNGLGVYRVMCVKRAIEEADGKRVLAWDGAAANAALLRAALPHARRVETIEINRYPDRAQRSRRFRPIDLVSQVRRFAAASVSANLIAVSELDPDEVRGDLSVLQGPVANGHADRDDDGPPKRSRRSQPRSGDRKPPRRRPARTTAQTSNATPTEASPDESKPRPRRKPAAKRTRQKKEEVAGAAPATDPAATGPAASATEAATPSADGDAPDVGAAEKPKSGRSRRGRRRGGRGRGNRKPSAGDSSDVSGSEDTAGSGADAVSTATAGPTAAASESGSDSQDVEGKGDTENRPARRRRGRRGGRNRRGGRRPAGTNDAPSEGTEGTHDAPIGAGNTPEESQA